MRTKIFNSRLRWDARGTVVSLAASSILLSCVGQLMGAIVAARSCAEGDVSAAIASAKNDDTVTVPAGKASWANTLTIAKPITVEGAGIGKTIIADDFTEKGNTIVIDTTFGKSYRLTGFEFQPGHRTTKLRKGFLLVKGNSRTFRVDHCKFNRLGNRLIVIRNAGCGVIDHCSFISNHETCLTILHDSWDGKRWGDGSWATPIDWGGPKAVYIEDNDFRSDPPEEFYGVLDEYAGARFVFRHNTVLNGVIASHGTGSSGRNRGLRQWEIYDNTLTAKPQTPKNAIHIRGGTGVAFNNTISGFGKFVTLHTYRYHTAFPKWPGSDGTCAWDLNDPKIYSSGTAGVGSGIGPSHSGGILVVPGAGWSMNQWVGYTVRNLDGLSNIQPSTSKGAGPGPFFSAVVSNTGDAIVVEGGSQQPNKIFAPGDRFEIRKVIQGLDMVGGSTGDVLAGNIEAPRWLHQKIEAAYIWNNTFNGTPNAGLAIAADSPIKEGVHFINNVRKPDYKPLVYPHPLVKTNNPPGRGASTIE